MVPSLADLPPGCTFAARCGFATDACRATYPPLEMHRPEHWIACWHADAVLGGERMTPLLEVRDLKKYFPVHKGVFSRAAGSVHAVDGISFHIDPAETLGLVGESGCGKSTAGRTVLKLLEPTSGTIKVDGQDISHFDRGAMLPYRRRMQMIYQDPYASLNPRMSVGDIVGEPLIIHGDHSTRASDYLQQFAGDLPLPGSVVGD